MNWEKSITVAFVGFALFIGVLVVVCVRQDISLVSGNYYEEELGYQKQIERLNNTQQLPEKPAIQVAGRQLEIRFSQLSQLDQAQVKLFRPSDSRLDRYYKLQKTSGNTQLIDLSRLPAGKYRASLLWTMGEKEYYVEQVIQL